MICTSELKEGEASNSQVKASRKQKRHLDQRRRGGKANVGFLHESEKLFQHKKYWARCLHYDDCYDVFCSLFPGASAVNEDFNEAVSDASKKLTWLIRHYIQEKRPVPMPRSRDDELAAAVEAEESFLDVIEYKDKDMVLVSVDFMSLVPKSYQEIKEMYPDEPEVKMAFNY